MNKEILDLIATYPTDGTHGYHWVEGFDGSTEDIRYKGALIMEGEEAKRTYCCGLTFEVFLKVAIKAGIDLGTPKDVSKLKADWFVATGKRRGPVDALVPRGLGTIIKLEDAQPGDFMQLWRMSGSGHSVIYLAHDLQSITYWSTQPSTNGIGRKIELRIASSKNPVVELYLVRMNNKKI